MRPQLYLTPAQLSALVAECRAAIPNEICGILGGTNNQVEQIYLVANAAHDRHTSFYMDPAELLQVLVALENQGLEMLATYHSHPPDARTDPSPCDLGGASYPGCLQVIIVPDPRSLAASVRAFDISDGVLTEVPITVRESRTPTRTTNAAVKGS